MISWNDFFSVVRSLFPHWAGGLKIPKIAARIRISELEPSHGNAGNNKTRKTFSHVIFLFRQTASFICLQSSFPQRGPTKLTPTIVIYLAPPFQIQVLPTYGFISLSHLLLPTSLCNRFLHFLRTKKPPHNTYKGIAFLLVKKIWFSKQHFIKKSVLFSKKILPKKSCFRNFCLRESVFSKKKN